LRRSKHRLDLILSGSQANVDETLHQLNMVGNGVPVRVIPYGVAIDGGWDMPRVDAVARMRALERRLPPGQRGGGGLWGRSGAPEPFVVTYLSRIDVEKGADLALHTLSLLRREGVPARLWIAGNVMPGSSYLDVLQTKIRLMDLHGTVSLIGTVNDQLDKVALLRASDAFAAAFIRSEPFGLVYTEAFASALPVVAPDTGAAPELMRYVGESTTLYPANDTGAMAARLRRLHEDLALRQRLSACERRTFLERFNATEMARAAAAEFDEAIRARGRRPHAPVLAERS
jgi:glycosyltransferase involved in cell wall biosynthesis